MSGEGAALQDAHARTFLALLTAPQRGDLHRTALGDAAFVAAWAAGQALSLDEAIIFALESPSPLA